jgi:hypothetical protein
MDLNPLALDPSACIPHIPNTDLREILKMYGDADVTVSISSTSVPPIAVGEASTGITEFKYLNDVTPSVVLVTTSLTTKEPL